MGKGMKRNQFPDSEPDSDVFLDPMFIWQSENLDLV